MSANKLQCNSALVAYTYSIYIDIALWRIQHCTEYIQYIFRSTSAVPCSAPLIYRSGYSASRHSGAIRRWRICDPAVDPAKRTKEAP